MSDGTPDIPGAVKGAGEIAKLAGKIYDDLVSPTAKQVGMTAGALAEAILLGPRELFFFTVAQAQAWLGAYVRQRLDEKGFSPERIRAPDPQVYVGTVVGMLGSGHVEELRRMFGNLLLSAMDATIAGMAHPSFADIVRQLSPAEARLIKYLRERGYIHTISVRAHHQILGGDHNIADHLSLVADEIGAPIEFVGTYFVNLARLGLVQASDTREITPQGEYVHIERDPRVRRILEAEIDWRRAYAVRGFVEITTFGTQFGTVCLDYDGPCPESALSKETQQEPS